MFARQIRRFFNNVFIAVKLDGEKFEVVCDIYKKSKKTKSISKNFDFIKKDEIPPLAIEFINSIQKEYTFSYISIVLFSLGQGAISGCETKNFQEHNIDTKNVLSFCIDKKWSPFSSYIEINYIKKVFSEIGIDFIFSPFLIIKQNINFLSEKPILYALNSHGSMTLAIFKGEKFLFGAHFKSSEDENFYDLEPASWDNMKKEKGIEGVDLMPSIDEGEEFGDIVNLDDLDEQNSANEFGFDNEEVFLDEDLDSDKNSQSDFGSIELFGKDLSMYKYLKSSIEEFYSNSLYDSDFLENITILDTSGITPEILDIIKNELFLKVEVKWLDLFEQTNKLAMLETEYEI